MSLFAFVYRRLDQDDKTFLECVQFPQSSTAVRKNETPTTGKWPQLCEWNYLANYLTEMYDIFLWNASQDKHSSSACLQTSVSCCPAVWGQGLGLRWFGRSRQRVSHGNESVLWSTTDDSALPHGLNRKATTLQPCLFPFLSKSLIVSESLGSTIWL